MVICTYFCCLHAGPAFIYLILLILRFLCKYKLGPLNWLAWSIKAFNSHSIIPMYDISFSSKTFCFHFHWNVNFNGSFDIGTWLESKTHQTCQDDITIRKIKKNATALELNFCHLSFLYLCFSCDFYTMVNSYNRELLLFCKRIFFSNIVN